MAAFGFENWPAILMAAGPALLNLGIAAFVLVRMRRNALTYVFALFVVAMAVWQTSEACTRAARSADTAHLCAEILSPGALLVAPLGMHFALLFAGKRHVVHSPAVLVLLYGPVLVFEVLQRAGFSQGRLVFDAWWGWQTEPPLPLVSATFAYWVILLTFGTFFVLIAFAARLPPDDDRRHQARLVAGGLAVPLVLGAATQVVLPTLFRAQAIPLTSAALTIFSVATVIALRNYRFLSLPTAEERLTEANRVIAEQRTLLAQAERMAHLGSWEWDIGANTVRWSPELLRIFQMDPEAFDATYEAYLERVHPDDRARVERSIRQAMETVEPFEFEHRITRADGAERILHARGRVHADDAGAAVRMTGTAQDVTQQREMERARVDARERAREVDRLRELNRFKTRFINTAAHELMTPMTPLRAVLYTMRTHAERAGDQTLVDQVDLLSRNVERLNRLASDLLDASRLEARNLGLQRSAVDVSELAQAAVEAFEARAADAGVSLRTDFEPGLVVDGDSDRLTQVLFNLLSNAVKFTGPGGRVHVTTKAAEDGALIRVRDTGVGIEPAVLHSLFRPFSRAHAETEADQPGTGLGLYISKGIVDLHGGKITCESAGAGEGTTFTVLLPLGQDGGTPP